jgi:DNA polymerase III epsilon subunit-like protein
MILLGIDFETTGLSPETDRVIEVGAILYSTGQKKCLESAGNLVKSDVPISSRITELTGITQSAVNKFGYDSVRALEMLLEMADLADAFIGQNVVQFDKRFLESWTKRENRQMPNKLWIDTRTDLPGVEGKTLSLMAAEAEDPITKNRVGFVNLFPHSALSDVQTCIKLVSMHDINKVVERAQSPTIVIIGHQKREDNQLAKERKFRWNPFYSVWWRAIKHMDLKQLEKECSFDISVAPPEVLLSKLWYE